MGTGTRRKGWEVNATEPAAEDPSPETASLGGARLLEFSGLPRIAGLGEAARDMLWRHIEEHGEEIVLVASPDWSRLLYISPNARHTWGFSPELTLAKWLEPIHPADQAALLGFLATAPEPTVGSTLTFPKFRVRRPDGSVAHLHCRAYPVADEHGQVVALAGIVLDETERVLCEQALHDSRSELQQMAATIERTQEEERRRIAQFVHDELGQSLALAKLTLEAFLSERGISRSESGAKKVLSAIQEAIDGTRRVAYDTSPPVLYELGLVPALEAQGEMLCSEHGLQFSIEADASPSLCNDNILLFRIVRELMLNVIKHAKAKHLRLIVENLRAALVIRVSDDGCGFDVDKLVTRYGLASVRQRLGYLGGELKLESVPGQGTVAEVRIPTEALV